MAILHKDKYYEKEKLYALFLAIAEHKYRFIFVCQTLKIIIWLK